jgi:ketosteroid isomerase-like protein
MSLVAALLLTTLTRPSAGVPADLRGEVKSLVEAERDFSKTSEKKGIREAFLTYLADNAILFRPSAVNGRQYMTDQPEDRGKLTWTPLFADVSAAGDMGYTTGPYEYRPLAGEGVGHGHYISVWKKQASGKWRVVADLGVVHPLMEGLPTEVSSPAATAPSSAKPGAEAARASLLAADIAFSDVSVAQGILAAYQAYAADEVRFYRMLEFPQVGKQAALAALTGATGRLTWKPAGGEAAQSGDLGVTYGVTEYLPGNVQGVSPIPGNYMRIWRRYETGWKVVVDVVIQLPQPAVQ